MTTSPPLTQDEKTLRKWNKKLRNAKTPEQTRKAEKMLKILQSPIVAPVVETDPFAEALEYNHLHRDDVKQLDQEKLKKEELQMKREKAFEAHKANQKAKKESKDEDNIKQELQQIEVEGYAKANNVGLGKAVEMMNDELNKERETEFQGKITKNILNQLTSMPLGGTDGILTEEQENECRAEISKNILHLPNDFIISTSWVTKVVQGDESQTHCHKNSYYSGVYYFDKYFKDSAKIEFINPNDKNIDFYLPPSKYNLHNSSSWVITPEKNKLLFFPSYLTHNILNNKNNNSRKSLAFNIVPVGEYGMGDSLIDTKWFKK